MLAIDSIFYDHYHITAIVDRHPDCMIYRGVDLEESLSVLVAVLPQPHGTALADVQLLVRQIALLRVPELLCLRDHFAQAGAYYLITDDPGGVDIDHVGPGGIGPIAEADGLIRVDRLLCMLDTLHEGHPPLFLGEVRAVDLWWVAEVGLRVTPFPLVRHLGSIPSAYRAPELHDAQAEPTTASDLYTVGAVLYHLLTGSPPPIATTQAVGTLQPPRRLNPQISALTEELVLRALEQKPTNRYQRAREMRSALETVRKMTEHTSDDTRHVVLWAETTLAPATLLGPLPATLPSAAPAPGTYVVQSSAVSSYRQILPPALPTPIPAFWMSNGCLMTIVTSLALMMLTICGVGTFVGRQIISLTNMPLLNGSGMLSPTAPLLQATPADRVQTPVPDALVVATEIFTQTNQLEDSSVGPAVYAPNGQMLAVGVGRSIQLRLGALLVQGPILTHHSGQISALEFAPDSAILASAAHNETAVILWDAVTGQEVMRLEGHTGWVRSVAFSPDGTIIASGSVDTTIRLWDVTSGRLLNVLAGHTDYVGDIAFSPNGSTLASASRDGTVRLWDVASGQLRAGFLYTAPINPATGAPYWLTGIAYSPDGKSIAVGVANASIYVIDVVHGQLQQELRGHSDWVSIRGLSYSPDGHILASASLDGTVRLWNPLTGVERALLSDRHLRLVGLCWAPDSQHLVSTSDVGGSVLIWDTQNAQLTRTILLAQGTVTSLAYAESGAVLATGGASGMVRLHNLVTGNQRQINGGLPTNQFIDFVSDTDLVAISDSGEVVVIDLSGQSYNRQLHGLTGVPMSITVSEDHTLVAAGSDRGEVVIWDVRNQRLIRKLQGFKGAIFFLAFDRQAGLIAAGANEPSGDARIIVWDVQSGVVKSDMLHPQTELTAIAMSAAGDLVASASSEGGLWFWNVATGSLLRSVIVSKENRWLSSLAFSPDGNLLVTGSEDGAVEFWTTWSGERLERVGLGHGQVMALTFRPDGKQLAVSTYDGGVYLFDAVE